MELFSRVFDTCLEFMIPDFMSDPDVPHILKLSTSYLKAFGIQAHTTHMLCHADFKPTPPTRDEVQDQNTSERIYVLCCLAVERGPTCFSCVELL